MIVQKVKGLLHRLLKLPGVELKLSYTCAKVSVSVRATIKQMESIESVKASVGISSLTSL